MGKPLPRRPADDAPEAEWQAWIVAHVEELDGRAMHVYRPDGAGMPEGWPDLVIFLPRLQLYRGRTSRILYRELKADGREPTDEQHAWLALIMACGGDVAVWDFPGDADRALREIGWHQPAPALSPIGDAAVDIDEPTRSWLATLGPVQRESALRQLGARG